MENKKDSSWPYILARKIQPIVSSAEDMRMFYTNLRQAAWLIKHMRKRKLPFLYEKKDMVFFLEVLIEAFGNAGAATYPDEFQEWEQDMQ